MRKEILWAIVAGITFGLVIAFGVMRVNSVVKPKGDITNSTSPTPESKPSGELKITLNSPENEDVVTTETVKVSGITKPLSWVTLSAEEGDFIVESDEKGVFEEEVDLVSGINQIKVTVFDTNGEKSIEKVLVVYSSAFEEASEDRLEKAKNKPKAYLGVVTDIADSTVQIRAMESEKAGGGEIRQIAVNKDEVSVVSVGKTNKIVNFTDIAIGDFIAAMGYINGNQVLNAQRILITPAVEEPKTEAIFGKKSEILGDLKPITTTQVFAFNEGKVTKVKFTSVDDEDLIIYTTTVVSTKTSIRSIFVIASGI